MSGDGTVVPIDLNVRIVSGPWQGFVCYAHAFHPGASYPFEVILPDDSVGRFAWQEVLMQ